MSAFDWDQETAIEPLGPLVANVQLDGPLHDEMNLTPNFRGKTLLMPANSLPLYGAFITFAGNGVGADVFQKVDDNFFHLVVNNSGLAFSDGQFEDPATLVSGLREPLLRALGAERFQHQPVPVLLAKAAAASSVEEIAQALAIRDAAKREKPQDKNALGALWLWLWHNKALYDALLSNSLTIDQDVLARFRKRIPERYRKSALYLNDDLLLALLSGQLSISPKKGCVSAPELLPSTPSSVWELYGMLVILAGMLDAAFETKHGWHDFLTCILDQVMLETEYDHPFGLSYGIYVLRELFPELAIVLRDASIYGAGTPLPTFQSALDELATLSWVKTSFAKFCENKRTEQQSQQQQQLLTLKAQVQALPASSSKRNAPSRSSDVDSPEQPATKRKPAISFGTLSAPSVPPKDKDNKGKACYSFVAHAAGVAAATACAEGDSCSFSHDNVASGDTAFIKMSMGSAISAWKNGKLRSIPAAARSEATTKLSAYMTSRFSK